MDGNEEDEFGLGDIQFDDILDEIGEEADLPGEEIDKDTPPDPNGDDKGGSDNDDPKKGNKRDEGNEEEEEEEPERDPQDKGESEKEEEDDPAGGEKGNDTTVVSEILEGLGYETDTEYEDTSEGLMQMVQDVGAQMAEEQLQSIFEKFPLIQKHFEFVYNGGKSDEFLKAFDGTRDYDKLNLNEDDVVMQRQILSDYLTRKGHDREFIDDMLKDYSDSEKLYDKAEKALKGLRTEQATERTRLIENQKKAAAEDAKRREEFWNGMQKTIADADELAGISLPKKDKSRFFEYISKPVTREGHTQRDLDHAEAEMSTKLAIDYLMFKGFDLSTLTEKKKATKNVKTLKARLKDGESKRSKSGSQKREERKGTGIDLEGIDYSAMF